MKGGFISKATSSGQQQRKAIGIRAHIQHHGVLRNLRTHEKSTGHWFQQARSDVVLTSLIVIKQHQPSLVAVNCRGFEKTSHV